MDINDLKHQRATLCEQMRALTDKADKEKRELTPEENAQFDTMFTDDEKLEAKIGRELKLRDKEKEFAEKEERRMPMPEPATQAAVSVRSTPEYRTAFNNFLLTGERRALQVNPQTSGGYVVPPEQFVNELIKAVDDQLFIRGLATKFAVPSAQSLGVPTLDANPADSDWTSEILTGSEDSTMTFGKRELAPKALAKMIKVSNKLLRSSAVPVDALIRDRFAYVFALSEEKAFLTGSGSNQPLGLFTASASGIPTSQDVSTGNAATAIGADGLIEAKYALKPQYMNSPTTRWLFSREAVKNIRKLKDGNGQYLWANGIAAGTPATILDTPYLMSEWVPHVFTSTLYVGLIGDFRFYWIADALDFSIQMVDQLYALTNQVAFIGRLETDAAPVLSEAFVRVKLG